MGTDNLRSLVDAHLREECSFVNCNGIIHSGNYSILESGYECAREGVCPCSHQEAAHNALTLKEDRP